MDAVPDAGTRGVTRRGVLRVAVAAAAALGVTGCLAGRRDREQALQAAPPTTPPPATRSPVMPSPATTSPSTTAATTSPGTAPQAAVGDPRWPGHQPGKVYLGASAAGGLTATVARTGTLGLRRTYYRWDEAHEEDRTIRSDHAAGRLPWVSFKPPSSAPGGWAAVAAGEHDADLRARARRYAALALPVVVTFHHEPHNDATGTPGEFAAAWCRVHDVMESETALENVSSVPVIGESVFGAEDGRGRASGFLTDELLDRCHFLGVDCYQNASGAGFDVRLGSVLAWLAARGHPSKMIGIGETGATDSFGTTPSGAAWWTSSWAWVVANTDSVGAVSYFNSLANNRSGNNWLLWESPSKLAAFRASLASPVTCTL